MKIIYFTATGNSLYIAKSLSNDIYSIPQLIKNNEYEFTDDKIGIVFPLYSHIVPPYVENFLKRVKFNCDYLFAVATYGIYDGAISNHLLEIAKNYNYKFNYINTIKMVDTWLPGFKMSSQVKNIDKKHIEEKLSIIKTHIDNNVDYQINTSMIDNMITKLQTKFKDRKSKKGSLHGNSIGLGIKKYLTVESGCIRCSTCVKVCPVNNIELVDDEIKLKDHCLSCFACTQNCPANVMRISKERDESRYRNSNVSLNEIINSNK